MSEKIYACLLRLFPSSFREAHGDAALQLFRDRARDERGFFRTVRLWLDLLADLAISVPREYAYLRPALIGASVQRRLDGAPAFYILAEQSPGPGALIFGCALSTVALSAFWILLGHAGNHRALRNSAEQRRHAIDARPAGSRHTTARAAGDAENAATGSAFRELPAIDASSFRPDKTRPNDSQSNALLPLDSSRFPQAQPQQPPDDASPMIGTPIEDVKLDAEERRRVIDAAVALLNKYYIDRHNAQNMADALLVHEKHGDDQAVTDGPGFAALLTRQMRDVSPDRHLTLNYSQALLPQRPTGPTPEGLARYREALKQQNCTFESLEVLPHNIGYVKLNSFPDVSVCRTAAVAAMASLNHADAIIFDLRDNRGGEPAMVALVAAYLFDHPEYLYNPRQDTTEQSWTHSPVAGNKLADKPVYLLTSARTFSGAEQFSYDLKMLKRATLVGETTGGGAHSGVWHRIDDHFGMGIPETKAINPFSTTDWAEIGVEPDVKVKAADALETAEKLAERRLQKK